MIDGVSRETMNRLKIYAAHLQKWNQRINLVSPSTINDLWARHIEDSAQLSVLVEEPRNWVDLGSGAGLPGLIIAALLSEKNSTFRMTCVESDLRKCVFMREVSREMGLNVTISHHRIETNVDPKFDVISARALAPLSKLLHYADGYRSPGAICLFPKGQSVEQELTDARDHWVLDAEKIASTTERQACILRVREFSRVSEN